MLEKILAAIKSVLTAKGIQLGDNEAALKTEIEKLIKESPTGEIDLSKLNLDKFTNTDNGKLLQALVQNQTKLETAITEIATLVKDSAAKVKADQAAIDAQKKTQHDADVKAAVDALIVTKKSFPEAMRAHLTKMADANLDSFKEIYKDAKAGKEFVADKNGGDHKNEPVIKSTSGNAKALEAIQKFQANAVAAPAEEGK